MPAANYDFEIEQGSKFLRYFVYKDDAGDPVDLTGRTARMQIRTNVNSPSVLMELTTQNDRIVIDGPEGKVTLTLTAQDTADIEWRKGVYDLELAIDADNVERFLAGAVTVSREVTR